MRRRIIRFICFAQAILFLGHWLLYETWDYFWGLSAALTHSELLGLRIGLAALSITFLSASLLAFRFYNFFVRVFYILAAAWLGILNYLFFAAIFCWVALGAVRLARLPVAPGWIAFLFFGAALAIGIYGTVNAAATRVTRVSVRLPNLPESWRGRVAALVADTHLGHVRSTGFMRRLVEKISRLGPDVVFVTGDLYDGTKCDPLRMAKPLADLHAPLGTFYVTGNHEEFFDREKYIDAVERAGLRVLKNEKVIVDGLQVIGVLYGDSVDPEGFRHILRRASFDREQASVLLLHAPDRLAIAEEEGIALQLSGHTHGGQFAPWTWLTSRIYGRFVHGLQRLRNMTIFTTWGVGTWGPPLRVGTKPEIVMIRFE